eukprot:349157_1
MSIRKPHLMLLLIVYVFLITIHSIHLIFGPGLNNVHIFGNITFNIKSSQLCNSSNTNSHIPPIYQLNKIQSNDKIPMIIWQTWETHEVANFPLIKPWIDRYKKLKFDHRLADNYEAQLLFTNKHLTDSKIYRTFGGNITAAFFMINPRNGAARADLWRYYVLWKFGGIYLDLDSTCYGLSSDAINNIIKKHSKDNSRCNTVPFAILSYEHVYLPKRHNHYKFVQWGLFFSPKHPFLEEVIRRAINRILYEEPKNVIPENMKRLTLDTTGTNIWAHTIYDFIQNKIKRNYSEFEYYIDGITPPSDHKQLNRSHVFFPSFSCSYVCNFTIRKHIYDQSNKTSYDLLKNYSLLIDIK